MLPEIKIYLEVVRHHLRLDPVLEKQVIGELDTHFEEKIAELEDDGLSEKEAVQIAIRSFGRPRVVAHLMYEACSIGTWSDTVLSALPHLIIASLFISGLWNNPLVSPAIFAAIVGVTLFGWRHGKPHWLYSWIGFSLTPLLLGGYAWRASMARFITFIAGKSQASPDIWQSLFVGGIFLFFAVLIVRTTIHVVRRDWVLASLMLAPLPIIAAWLFNIEELGGVFRTDAALQQWDAAMSLAFGVMGLSAAFFIRFRRRLFKISAVVMIGSIALTMVVHNIWGRISFLGLLAFFVLMMVFLLAPFLVEKRVGHGDEKAAAWWATYEYSTH